MKVTNQNSRLFLLFNNFNNFNAYDIFTFILFPFITKMQKDLNNTFYYYK